MIIGIDGIFLSRLRALNNNPNASSYSLFNLVMRAILILAIADFG